MEIQLRSSIGLMTRSLNVEEQTQSIGSGQTVGVTIEGANQEHVNVPWVSDGAGNLNWSQTKPLYFNGSKKIQVMAYKPYNEDWTDVRSTTYTFTVAQDQTEDGYIASDLLWTAQTSAPASSVNLNFRHQLAKIVINVSSETLDEELLGAQVYVSNVYPSIPFTGGILGEPEGEKIGINLGALDQNLHACAIIVPQVCEEGLSLIRIVIGEEVYVYKLPENKEFKSGYVYTYNLSVVETDPMMKAKNITAPGFGEEQIWN